MKKLVFLENWKTNWGSAKATNHCGTFNYAYSTGYNWYIAYNCMRLSRLKLVQGMTLYATHLPVSTEIRLVQGMTTLRALIYRALD